MKYLFTLNAKYNIALSFEFSLLIPCKNGYECSDLENIIEKHSHSSLQAESCQSWNIREGSN
jgi:hypothetical protein